MPEIQNVRIDRIDASPFQHRRHFDEGRLKELAKSIEQDGLVEPVVVRKVGRRLELIAGERRVRAVRDYTGRSTILARIATADDQQARRMCAAENLQRDDLSPVESIEAIIELLDAELYEDDGTYSEYGDSATARVSTLLAKMHSDAIHDTQHVDNKFIISVTAAFAAMPKRLEWQSFFVNDLPLITKVSEDVRDVATQHKLNKSQTKALAKVADDAQDVFQHLLDTGDTSPLLGAAGADEDMELRDLSATQIRQAAARRREQDKVSGIEVVDCPAPSGTYDVIVIDPPWEMKKISRDAAPNQAEFDYPTMSEGELAELDLPCADSCHVWIWTTHKHLPMTLRLAGAWNLTYVCAFVWHKPGGFQPFGLPQYNCEFALYCRRGTPKFSETKAFPVCFDAARGAHSEKPEEFYEVIRRVTSGSRLDMFNRRRIEGFDGWGNESV